jgi:hypothetical protein
MSDIASASLDLAAVMALRDAGRPAEAEARLSAGGPPDADALALLSHLQLLQGRPAEAQAAYDAFLEAAVAAAGRGETLPRGWRPGA